ncbi:MAG: winged helix-turn-helix transcriptional regulator [bacterium]|nr:winged helix-turn-helix transcriptional regulator [bacterium]
MKSTQMTPTRERVLRFIKAEGKVSVKALTDEIGITPMAIRGHLNKLEKDELIAVSTVRQKLGRPLQVFTLTEKGDSFFPKDYGRFAVELLEDLKQMDDGATLGKVMQIRENRIIEELKASMKDTKDPAQRIEIFKRWVDQHGNMPNVEHLGGKNFQLCINNCSLKTVVEEFPVCCDSEVSIIHALFPDAKIEKTKSLRNSDKSCCYRFEFS